MRVKHILIHLSAGILAYASMCMPAQAQTAAINNGQLRSGNGAENSINIRGNLQQPFYRANNSWYKLTYSNYALDAAFATGGSGAEEWNTEGVILLNSVMENHVIDASEFTYNSESTEAGTGTLVSTGDLSFGSGPTLQVEQTYTLLPDEPFIKTRVKLTNTGSTTAQNVRMWIGTRDDWVGSTDRPLKQKGNLINNSFQPSSSPSQRASAVRITSLDEGVLFYADTEKANAVLNHCCSFYNIMYQNPNTSALSHSSDGSYGFYVRFDNLAPGESEAFTWYYAAGTIDELDDIINQVAQASGAISDLTCSSAKFTAATGLPAIGHYMAVPAGSEAPTPAEIAAGTNYGNVTVADTGSAQMTANTAHTFDIEGLNPGEGYTVYFTSVLEGGDFSEAVSYNFTTVAPLELSFSVTDAGDCSDSGTGAVSVSVTGGIGPFTYAWDSGEETAAVINKTVGYYEVEVSDSGACPAVSGSALVGADDQTAPLIEGKSFEIALNEYGTAEIGSEEIQALADNGSTDNCGLAPEGFALSKTSFTCADIGENSVIYTVTDFSGHTADTAITITVSDNRLPVAAVQNITLVLGADGTAFLDAETADAGSYDNCGITQKEIDTGVFTCADLGANSVTLTLTDSSNNTVQAAFTVTVEDHTAPVVSFITAPVLYLNEEGTVAPTENGIISEISDNCGITSAWFDTETFDCTDVGIRTLRFSAEDASGNIGTAETAVLIADTVKPEFYPDTVTVSADENGTAYLTEEMLLPYAADNCGIAEVAIHRTEFSCNAGGAARTEIIVTDLYGNHIQRTLQVKVNDLLPPEVSAEDITLTLDETGSAYLSPEQLNYTASDNCGVASVGIFPSRFDCSHTGPQKVTLTAWDHAGNETHTTFIAHIKDSEAPVFEETGPLRFCEGEVGFADYFRAQDNCSVKIIRTEGPASGSYLSAGVYSVSFTATDPSGNSSTKTEVITVDAVPVLQAPDTVLAIPGEPAEIRVDAEAYTEILWSDGTRGPDAAFTLNTPASVSVTALNNRGCETSRNIRIDLWEASEVNPAEKALDMKIYPNPTRGILHVEPGVWGDAPQYNITVTDLHGKTLIRDVIFNGVSLKSMDMSVLSQGLYLITLQSPSERITLKFNKM